MPAEGTHRHTLRKSRHPPRVRVSSQKIALVRSKSKRPCVYQKPRLGRSSDGDPQNRMWDDVPSLLNRACRRSIDG